MESFHPIPKGRLLLSQVLARAGDTVRIDDVERTLQLNRDEAAKRLSRWHAQGWLHRVAAGVYIPVSLDTIGTEQAIEDPWVLVPALFSPGYVGGRTAAEHWDLTEQIFKDIVVMTTQPLRQTQQVRHGTTFTLRHIAEPRLFGTKTVWRKRSRVQVSDVHRTIIDMLDEPTIGAGIQHVSDCLTAYFLRNDRDDKRLLDYAARVGNGAVYKRLGFFADRTGADALAQSCLAQLTAGIVKLDPAQENAHLVARWRLRVPISWATHQS